MTATIDLDAAARDRAKALCFWTMTEAGAAVLADEIEAYWRERGWRVRCRVERVRGAIPGARGALFCVRSDMINGLPRERLR